MGLSDDLGALGASNYRGPRCATGATLRALPDADQQAIADALARGIPATVVSELLRRNGIDIAAGSLRRHTAGICRCPKSETSPSS